MTYIKSVIRTVGVAAAVTLAVSAAKAQPAAAEYQINNGGLETVNWSFDGNSDSGLAGGITLTYVSGSTQPGTFTTICTDLGGVVYLGENYSYSAPQFFAGRSGLDPTWGTTSGNQMNNAAAAIQAAAEIFNTYSYVLAGNNTDAKAGLQLAVWAALYNTTAGATLSSSTTSLNGPRFNVLGYSGAAYTDAATYMTAANFQVPYVGSLLIPEPNSQNGLTAQEMLVNVTPVPEPTTLIAGALLLVPFAASTIRLRKNRAA